MQSINYKTKFTRNKLTISMALAMSPLLVNAQFNATEHLSSLNGSNGFVINGEVMFNQSGNSVASAGDINGDGIDDVIIGAQFANANYSGSSYVVFGKNNGFSSALNLSALNGNNGFIIDGIAENDRSGLSVNSAGDVNGDGVNDVIIGTNRVDINGDYSGSTYVVFGNTNGFSSTVNLSSLNGSNGFALNGVSQYDNSGFSVDSAGDFNGDGIDDLIIGAYGVNTNGSGSGASYVVFGHSGNHDSFFDLSTLNGSNGFVINGVAANNRFGTSVSSAGDVNDDGLDDVIIGAIGANGFSGTSYVVFGQTTASATFNASALNGNNGFALNGNSGGDLTGNSVSSAGDINGDGVDDLIVGAYFTDTNGDDSGSSYVVFGSTNGFTASLNLSSLNGNNGFVLEGVSIGDRSGNSVSQAGDVNGDGINDLIIGAYRADINNTDTGSSYVLFGKSSPFSSSVNLSSLNGNTGFVLVGANQYDISATSVSNAGDVNGDGIDDLIIGAKYASTNGTNSGASYVVFGNDTIFSNGF